MLELLDEQTVGAGEDLPVQVARLVPRLVRPVFRELHREPAKRRAVDSGEEALDDALGHDLDPAEARHLGGIQQIDTLFVGHRHGKLMSGRVSGVEDRPHCWPHAAHGRNINWYSHLGLWFQPWHMAC